jgi:proteasome lid subunit RPN8/RPN11
MAPPVLELPSAILTRIHGHGEAAYPEEGAGFLLGADAETRRVSDILPLPNDFDESMRRRRYLITPEAYLQAELTAERLGLELIGVFHSHPDHPNEPSSTDLEWAQPFFSYLITNVQAGRATGSRSWRLKEDRTGFLEESVAIFDQNG